MTGLDRDVKKSDTCPSCLDWDVDPFGSLCITCKMATAYLLTKLTTAVEGLTTYDPNSRYDCVEMDAYPAKEGELPADWLQRDDVLNLLREAAK